MAARSQGYEKKYSEKSFWAKVKSTAGSVPFVNDVVALYYCMMDSSTPMPVKASIVACLGYFISPVDAIPDIIAMLGFTDDAGVVTATLALVGTHVTADHYRQSRAFLNDS